MYISYLALQYVILYSMIYTFTVRLYDTLPDICDIVRLVSCLLGVLHPWNIKGHIRTDTDL